MSDFKARLSTIHRGLNDALGKAAAYQDADLSPEGLQAKRAELTKAARAIAVPKLAAVRAEVKAAAVLSAGRASAALPKIGTNADATARMAAKWSQVKVKLDAGEPLRDIIKNADADTIHAIAEYGPSYAEAKAYKAPGIGEALNPGPAVDHSALVRAFTDRMAGLTGEGAVSALKESRVAAGEAAYVEVVGGRLDSLIAGTTPNSTMLSTALAAENAERLAVNGLPEQEPKSDSTKPNTSRKVHTKRALGR
jgi:hypothetical protein